MVTGFIHPRARKAAHQLICLLLTLGLVLSSFGSPVWAAGLSGFTTVSEDSYVVAPGVVHQQRTLAGDGHVEAVQHMEVDPSNPHIKLEVTSPKGKVIALDTVRNQAAQIDREGHRVVGGFNMDFFNTDPTYAGAPNGLQVSNGEVVTAASLTRVGYLALRPDGSFHMGREIRMTAQLSAAGGEAKTLTALNKPRTSSATNHMYLYNARFSATTKSAGSGVEVIINPEQVGFRPGQPLKGTVESVSATATNTAIPAFKWVLSASGAQADWVKANLTVGKAVELNVSLSGDVGGDLNGVSQIVTGGVMLVSDGQPTATALADNVDRHPRTFVAEKEGKLHIIAFDGRQPTYSDGVTLAEGAKYLADLGMETAFNADGGGSTTYAARQPGDAGLSVLNRPSDGFERSVSNALMVVSTAPLGELTYLVPQPKGPLKVLAGGQVAFSAKGQDQYYNPAAVDPASLTWEADAAVGAVDGAGVLTAVQGTGEGSVSVRTGGASAQVDVQVVDRVAKLTITPNPAVVNPGMKQVFTVQGFDAEGREILISPDRLTWSTEGNIGMLSATGELATVAGSTASGKVIAAFGDVRVEAVVNVGKPPVMIEDFEDITDLYTSSARANSVVMSLMSRPNPVRYGTHAAKLAYDFTGQAGTSAAYINIRGAGGLVGRALEERPTKLGLWVYGDGKNHWLRGQYEEGNGTKKTIDFTATGGLNWVGWKYVEAALPSDVVLPLKLRQLYLVETSAANKNAGAIYFDNLRAVYSDTGEDLVGPTFGSYAPAAGKKIYTNTPTISATVRDEGTGVDGGSLKMLLDGKLVEHVLDAATGKITYVPAAPLADGEHTVSIDAVDKAGNPALPKADWKFTVYTGPDVDAPSVSVIAPHDGTTTRTDQPRIAVKLADEYTGISYEQTSLEVDGQAVAVRTDAASGTIWFTPGEKWANGSQHSVKAVARDKNGNAATKEWSFTIGEPLGQPQDPNHFQMSIIGDGGYYTAGQGQTAADILLREQIARINQEPSELIGYTGDIVENDTAANYATAVQNMDQFKAPYVVSIGNHEISGTNSRTNYQKTFGEPTYFYDYGNSRLIGLDSASGKISNSDASQWPWLQETLEATEANHIILIMHVPPDEISADGRDFNTGHGFKDTAEAQRFYDLMGAYKAAHPEKQIVVLSGDLHAYHHKNVQGVDYIISGGGGKYTHTTPEDGGFFHYVNLRVEGEKVAWDVIPLLDQINWVGVNGAEAQQLAAGEQLQLKANGKFLTSTNAPITMPVAAPFKVEWTTSDPSIAMVDGNGVVTAVAPGTATLTVKSGWREASVQVYVPTRLTSDLPAEQELRRQQKYAMTTAIHPDDAGKEVSLRITLKDAAQVKNIDLKHMEADGEFHKLVFDANGVASLSSFSLASHTDAFMVKFDALGTYEYVVELLHEGDVLASKTEKVVVYEKRK